MVSWFTLKQVREEYRKYLEELHPEWSTNTLNTHVSDSFYLYNNDGTNSFWSYLVSDEAMLTAKREIEDYLCHEIHSEKAEERAKQYYADLCVLKQFFDDKFGGVKERIGTEFDAEKLLFEYCKQAYEGTISVDEAVAKMTWDIPAFKDVSHRLTTMVFAAMMEGKKYTRRVNMEMTIYLIKRIGQEYGKEKLENALVATRENIIYYFEQTGNKSIGMRRGCRKIASENNLDIDFSDSIFDGLTSKQETDTTLLPDAVLEESNSDGAPMAYLKDDFLQDVYMTEEEYDTLHHLVTTKKNVILQGAPGVGKTYAAMRFAFSYMQEKDYNRVQMIQFHQSYSYEDFIMGFRPQESANGFELKAGVFYNFCKLAEKDEKEGSPYFFIIDEINRGNLSKIFGELFMLIENDKRGVKLKLLYKDEEFSIPSNVYIIGMMNTADRSLAMMDYALRRRFAFFEMEPAFSKEAFKAERLGKNKKYDSLISCVKALNKVIAEDESLGEGFRIGHSYFCTKAIIDDMWLHNVVKYELIPLLKEYWFDDPSKVDIWSENLWNSIK